MRHSIYIIKDSWSSSYFRFDAQVFYLQAKIACYDSKRVTLNFMRVLFFGHDGVPGSQLETIRAKAQFLTKFCDFKASI